MKVKVRSTDRDLFDIVTNVLQGDTLEPYLFIIFLDYVLWILVENSFTLKKGKKQKIPGTNDHRHRLRWWHSASGKYTCPSWIPIA